jgi:hypothetical protein
MKKYFLFTAFLFNSLLSFAQSPDEVDIKKVMDFQVNSWNAGNIDDFMKSYWQNDSLMFIGKSGITYGWRQTLEHYKKSYPDRKAMGNLNFNLLELKQLSANYYFIVGKWDLQRYSGDIGGYFTLLFKKINGIWLIIADHTS